jgi:uncharacterized protein YndB with AHSA1/START domain
MPTQKDFKRLVRSRMKKTGESYTAARLQLLNKRESPLVETREPSRDLAAAAGMSDAAVSKRTGRTWAQWVDVLDARQAAAKPHRGIVEIVSSLGTPEWWSQMVTVGYERIRGLRERGQRRDGGYEASKSRTYNVPVATLFDAFASARRRNRWLPVRVAVRSSARPKRMRIEWDDKTVVQVGFLHKGRSKSAVAIQHQKLRDKAAASAMKTAWGQYFDELREVLS